MDEIIVNQFFENQGNIIKKKQEQNEIISWIKTFLALLSLRYFFINKTISGIRKNVMPVGFTKKIKP